MSGKLAKGLYRYYIRINRSLFMFGYNTYIVANDKVIINSLLHIVFFIFTLSFGIML